MRRSGVRLPEAAPRVKGLSEALRPPEFEVSWPPLWPPGRLRWSSCPLTVQLDGVNAVASPGFRAGQLESRSTPESTSSQARSCGFARLYEDEPLRTKNTCVTSTPHGASGRRSPPVILKPSASGVSAKCSPHRCQPLANGSIRVVHAILSGAFTRAVRWGWIAVNPVDQVEPPSVPRPNPHPPTAAEAAMILNEAWKDADWGVFVLRSMTTGACRGEVCGCAGRILISTHRL
jgi:hypothetical protein